MNKLKLNKKLKSVILDVPRNSVMKYGKVRVVRAREIKSPFNDVDCRTEVDIKISAIVKSTLGVWLPLSGYGPRSIRKFLRKNKQNVNNTVNSWTKLWGLPSDYNITISNIEILDNPCKL